MTDTQRILRLESELHSTKAELEQLKLTVTQLKHAYARKDSVQDAVDDLQNSVQLIFKHVHVPNVLYKPGKRLLIT